MPDFRLNLQQVAEATELPYTRVLACNKDGLFAELQSEESGSTIAFSALDRVKEIIHAASEAAKPAGRKAIAQQIATALENASEALSIAQNMDARLRALETRTGLVGADASDAVRDEVARMTNLGLQVGEPEGADDPDEPQRALDLHHPIQPDVEGVRNGIPGGSAESRAHRLDDLSAKAASRKPSGFASKPAGDTAPWHEDDAQGEATPSAPSRPAEASTPDQPETPSSTTASDDGSATTATPATEPSSPAAQDADHQGHVEGEYTVRDVNCDRIMLDTNPHGDPNPGTVLHHLPTESRWTIRDTTRAGAHPVIIIEGDAEDIVTPGDTLTDIPF